jgi:hypothetical protein
MKSNKVANLSKRAIERLAAGRWELVSDYLSAKDKATFKCLDCGESLVSTVNRMTSNRPLSCTCRRQVKKQFRAKLRVEKYKKIAAKRGGLLLSNPESIDEKEKYLWRCGSGHEWKSTVGSVIGANSWCPICAGNSPRQLGELKDIVESRGGKLLDTEYKGVEAKYSIICSQGHSFRSQFKRIVGRGSWCSICSKGSKSEELARTTLEQIFGKQFPKGRPSWLRNNQGYRMELDGYCEELGIAFEYQGEQHFKQVSIFNSDLEKRIRDDDTKRILCSQNGVKLIVLDHTMDPISFGVHIKVQAEKLGIHGSYEYLRKVDLNRAYIREDRLNELKKLLEPKFIEVLSTKWIDTDTRYRFHCLKCGHKWSARGDAFFNSRRVAGCKKCAMKNLRDKQRGNLSTLNTFALKFGGKVLSDTYKDSQSKYQFECRLGHVFEGKFNNMVNRGQFCPICEGRQQRETSSKDVADRWLSSRSLRALEEFVSFEEPILCQCDLCLEKFPVVIRFLKQGIKGCPFCSGHKTREVDALQILKELEYRPITPFPGGASSWLVECLKCHSPRKVVISSLRNRKKKCSHKGTEHYVLRKR